MDLMFWDVDVDDDEELRVVALCMSILLLGACNYFLYDPFLSNVP